VLAKTRDDLAEQTIAAMSTSGWPDPTTIGGGARPKKYSYQNILIENAFQNVL